MKINLILEINLDVIFIVEVLDYERKINGVRGLLYGIFVLFKDNIEMNDFMYISVGIIVLE